MGVALPDLDVALESLVLAVRVIGRYAPRHGSVELAVDPHALPYSARVPGPRHSDVPDSPVNDQTSILRLIEDRLGLAPLSTRDAAVNGLPEAFDFTSAPRPFAPT